MSEKVILAYSGGLDTSCILKWLLEEGYEVVCFMADVGQEEDFEVAREKALKIGASQVVIKDLRQSFVEQYIWPAIQMGLIYEGRYLLGTSLARPCISVGLIETVRDTNAKYIAHGATGKGNDQIRFELSSYALQPDIKIIAPWRLTKFCNRFQGRNDLIEYAKSHNIPVTATPKEPWSTDANILHISYESGILEDPGTEAPSNLYQMTKNPCNAPDIPARLNITFKRGLPVSVNLVREQNNIRITAPLEMLNFLNAIGGEHGVGRIDIVENRYIGLKSRGVYETPGGTILYCAHHDLEVFCLDKEVYRVKSLLRDRMADYIYNGYWFSPEANYVRQCLISSQDNVNGSVTLDLYKGNVWVVSRESEQGLYNKELVSMNVHGQFCPMSASGFIEINALRLKEHHRAYGSISSIENR